ncbi:MAG: hypothetical protein IKD71_08575 [Solobacterium sp.]|nr:hypothetical protein [Solobacterium sp.]
MAVRLVFGFITLFAIGGTILNLMSQKHGKYLQAMLNDYEDDEQFTKSYQKMMDEDNDATFREKGNLLKMWHDIDKGYYDRLDEDLERIDLDVLIGTDEAHVSIGNSEDALSYLYLLGPGTLYSRGLPELADKLAAKRAPYAELVKTTAIGMVSEANEKYFRKEDDLGMEFYEGFLSGIYNNLSFNSTLINLYKDIAAVNYLKYCYDNNWPNHFAEYAMYLPSIHKQKIGKRWMDEVGLILPDAFYSKDGSLDDYIIPGYINEIFAQEPPLKGKANTFTDEVIEDEIIDDTPAEEPEKEEAE